VDEDLVSAKGTAANRRQFLKRAGQLGLAALAAPTIASTAGASVQTKRRIARPGINKTIAYSDPFTTSPVVVQESRFAGARAAEVGYNLLVDNAQGKLDEQLSTVETWVSTGVPAIVILPFEDAAFEDLAAQAVKKGIVWISLTAHMKHETAAILFQNQLSGSQIGRDAARWINATLGGRAKVLYLTFDAVEAGRERHVAFAKQIKMLAPKAKVVAAQTAYDPPGGLKVTETVLTAHPDLNVVIGINDGGVLGAFQAFKNARVKDPSKVYLGGEDGPKEALEAIKSGAAGGIYRATAAFSVRGVGNAIIDVPKAILQGAKPKDFRIPTVVLHQNSPQLDKYLADAGF